MTLNRSFYKTCCLGTSISKCLTHLITKTVLTHSMLRLSILVFQVMELYIYIVKPKTFTVKLFTMDSFTLQYKFGDFYVYKINYYHDRFVSIHVQVTFMKIINDTVCCIIWSYL